MAWPGHQALFAVQGIPAYNDLDGQQKANAVFMVRSGAAPDKAVEDAKQMSFKTMVPMSGLHALPQSTIPGFSLAGVPMAVPNSNIHPMYGGMMMQPMQAFPEQQRPHQSGSHHHHHHHHSHHHQHQHQQQPQQQHQSVHRPQSYSRQSPSQQPRHHQQQQQSQYSHQHQQQPLTEQPSSHQQHPQQQQQQPQQQQQQRPTTSSSVTSQSSTAQKATSQTTTTAATSATASTTAAGTAAATTATASTSRKSTWHTYKDPTSGRDYYYNSVTKEKQWEKPAELRGKNEWQAFEDPKSKRAFYYNQATGEKQWECPAEFAAQKAKKEQEEEEEKKREEKEERDRNQQQQLEKERREKAAAAEEAAQEEARKKAQQQQATWDKARAMQQQQEVVQQVSEPVMGVQSSPPPPPPSGEGINVSELFQVARQVPTPSQPVKSDNVMDKVKSALEAASKSSKNDAPKEDFVKQLLQVQANRRGPDDESEDPHRLAKQEQRRQQRERLYGDVHETGSNIVRESFGLGLTKKERLPEKRPTRTDNFNDGDDDQWRDNRQEARDRTRREWNTQNGHTQIKPKNSHINSAPRHQNGSSPPTNSGGIQIKSKNPPPVNSSSEKVKVKIAPAPSPQNKPALNLRLGDHVVFTRDVSRGNISVRQWQHGTIKIVDPAAGVYHVEVQSTGNVIGGLHPSFVELAKKQMRENSNSNNNNFRNNNSAAKKIVVKAVSANDMPARNNNINTTGKSKVQAIVSKPTPSAKPLPPKTKLTPQPANNNSW